MKTKKRAVVLLVALWAVLGGILYKDYRDGDAERERERLAYMVSKIRNEVYALIGPDGADIVRVIMTGSSGHN